MLPRTAQVVLVKERYIALAMLRLVEMEKAVVEGGGAVGLAAMLQGALPELAGRRVVLPLCGGNVDTPVLGRVLERGMAADGRLVKFEAVVSDRPGGIAGLTKVRRRAERETTRWGKANGSNDAAGRAAADPINTQHVFPSSFLHMCRRWPSAA
jgi:hypothetical protein